MKFDPNRRVGYESAKAYAARCASGFWDRFVVGPNVIDIGYRGGMPNAMTLCDTALGIELGLVGYDGLHLPVPDRWADTVHASHVLEHVSAPDRHLQEWFRTLRIGGTMILMVPHAFLYERRLTVPPSRWSPEHLFSVTPASLLALIERSLEPNTYRIRHLADNDMDYDYLKPLDMHPTGCLEIECVIQRILPPMWRVEP